MRVTGIIGVCAAITAAAVAPLVAQTPAPATSQSADQAIQKAVTAYRTIKTAKGSFSQTVRNRLTGTVYSSRGDFQQRMPREISVAFTDPKNDRIVSDGKVLWLYLPSTNPGTAIKLRVGTGIGSVALIGQFIDSPQTRYRISGGAKELLDGRSVTVVKLVPKDSVADFDEATVWVDDADGMIRQFETVERPGVVRRIHLLAVVNNAPVDAAAFTFVVPKGVRVEDRTG
jgi:outer membrane lipoprotein carrier protein